MKLTPCLLALWLLLAGRGAAAQEVLVFPGANSRDTHASIHNIPAAHALARGEGVRVGILDHSFGLDAHPELYAGGEAFQTDRWRESLRTNSHHGYWMALTLREVAPAAEIYALNTYSPDEAVRADAMARALDWAIAHRLHVVTYSAQAFSAAARRVLDPAVERAVQAGITVVFIHYPHPQNLLPTWLGPSGGDEGREADVNIFQYDYTVVFPERYTAVVEGRKEDARGYQPFLSLSSTAVVAGGIAALMLSANPSLTPADVKRLMRESASERAYEGRRALRVPDAAKAVELSRAARLRS